MPALQEAIAFIEVIQALPLHECILCGNPIPTGGCPLCPECDEEERILWVDYRAEQGQARHPY